MWLNYFFKTKASVPPAAVIFSHKVVSDSTAAFGPVIFQRFNTEIPVSLRHPCCVRDVENARLTRNPKSDGCVLMLLDNLAYTEWLTTNCDDKRYMDLVCFQLKNPKNITVDFDSFYPSPLFCVTHNFLRGDWCYRFTFVDSSKGENATRIAGRQLNHREIHDIDCILLAIGESIDVIKHLSPFPHATHLFYERFYETVFFEEKQVLLTNSKGHLITKYKSKNVNTWTPWFRNTFVCHNGHIISSLFLCNGRLDCGHSDNSDEQNCTCHSKEEKKFSICKFLCEANRKCQCSQLYYSTLDGKCKSFLTFAVKSRKTTREATHFFNGSSVNLPSRKKSPVLIAQRRKQGCSRANTLSCRIRWNQCFWMRDICVYKLDKNNNLASCRGGEHMQQCKDFQCNRNFKCPGYYCIPFSYTCDGKWDCPQGFDEPSGKCHKQRLCKGLFHCSNSQICLHPSDVCNRHNECPQRDDEILCEVRNTKCVQHCLCLNLAIQCTHVSFSEQILLKQLKFASVHISNSFTSSQVVAKLFTNVHVLAVSHNSLSHACWHFSNNNSLVSVDLRNNRLSVLERHCFYNMSTATLLNLDCNKIRSIHPEAFSSCPKMAHLSFARNHILSFDKHFFVTLENVRIVNFIGNPLTSLESDSFQYMTHLIVLTKKYQVCCIVPESSKCKVHRPWFKSCSSLIPTIAMKVLLGVVCSSIIFLNTVSVFLHGKLEKLSTFSLAVVMINISDMLCGIYLFVLLIADAFYGNNFIFSEDSWRAGTTCNLIFVICLTFSFESTFFILFMALARSVVIASPFSTNFSKISSVGKILVAFGLLILGASAGLGSLFREKHQFSPTSLCLPFIDPTNSSQLIKFLTITISLIQVLSSGMICLAYAHIMNYMTIQNTQMQCAKSKKMSSVPLIVQLIFVTVSNILCWIPSNAVYFASLFLSRYPTDLLIWTAIAVTPINSIVNPTVFIVIGLRRKMVSLARHVLSQSGIRSSKLSDSQKSMNRVVGIAQKLTHLTGAVRFSQSGIRTTKVEAQNHNNP